MSVSQVSQSETNGDIGSIHGIQTQPLQTTALSQEARTGQARRPASSGTFAGQHGPSLSQAATQETSQPSQREAAEAAQGLLTTLKPSGVETAGTTSMQPPAPQVSNQTVENVMSAVESLAEDFAKKTKEHEATQAEAKQAADANMVAMNELKQMVQKVRLPLL